MIDPEAQSESDGATTNRHGASESGAKLIESRDFFRHAVLQGIRYHCTASSSLPLHRSSSKQ